MQPFYLAGQLDQLHPQVDMAIAGDGVAGIEQQVEQDHLQLPGIDFDQRQVRLQHHRQRDRTG